MIKKGQISINSLGNIINSIYHGDKLVFGTDNHIVNDYSEIISEILGEDLTVITDIPEDEVVCRLYNILYGHMYEYMTFTALEDGTFSFTMPAEIDDTYVTSVSYSIDNGTTWVTTNNTNEDVTITTPTIQAGNSVLWKGIALRGYATGETSNKYSYFSSTCNYNASGNFMSFVYSEKFRNAVRLPDGFKSIRMFGNNNIINANNLIFISTKEYCYAWMFFGCSSLTSAPMLISTGLSSVCYYNMFNGCSSLTSAPVLPAKTLANSCYKNMFSRCSNLNYVKMMATNINAYEALDGWLNNVSAKGTFVKNVNAKWSNKDVVPANWAVETVEY